MSGLSKPEKFKIREMASEITLEVAWNPHAGSMIEFQNDFVESLYNTMAGLTEDDEMDFDMQGNEEDADMEEDEEDDGQEKWAERDGAAA